MKSNSGSKSYSVCGSSKIGLNRRTFVKQVACAGGFVVMPVIQSAHASIDPVSAVAIVSAASKSPVVKQQITTTLALAKGVCSLGRVALRSLRESLTPDKFVIRDKKWVESAPTPEERAHREYAAKAVPANGVAHAKLLTSDRFPVLFTYPLLPIIAPFNVADVALDFVSKVTDQIAKTLSPDVKMPQELAQADLNVGEAMAIDKVRGEKKIVATPDGWRQPMGDAQKESLQKDLLDNKGIKKSQREKMSIWTCLYRRILLDSTNQRRLAGYLFQDNNAKPKTASDDTAPVSDQWFVIVPDSSDNKAGNAYNNELYRLLDDGPPNLLT